MSVVDVVLLSVAGGLGAVGRFLVDSAVAARVRGVMPVGTIVVNVSGSFLIGVLAGATHSLVTTPGWSAVIATGLLGGYTTFSAASVDTLRLLRSRRVRAAALYAAGTLVVSVGAALIGIVAASAALGVG